MLLQRVTRLLFYQNRLFSNEVRVRFAPSPTGNLHLGGLRTALVNYLFAKSKNGKFILRIEDTDRKRLVPGAAESLEEDLNWVGLCPDEGPLVGGSYGPYKQTERSEIYISEAEKLIEKDAAYWCFCSERRLDLLRKDATRRQQVPKYDNKCRHLTKEEIKNKMHSGSEKCIRFKLSDEDNEGDPVVLKADLLPTYHLASVVDDHHMAISHVIRGVEWLPSTTKHLQLYKALDYAPPQFVHLPLLLNSDGSKISKRQGDLSVGALRAAGTLPSALVSLLCSVGGGFPSGLSLQQLSLQKLIPLFDLNELRSSAVKVPMDRLAEFNQSALSHQLSDASFLNQSIKEVTQLIRDKFSGRLYEDSLLVSEDHVRSVLAWAPSRVSYLKELVSPELQFLWVRPNYSSLSKDSLGLLSNLINTLEEADFSKKNLTEKLRDLSKIEGVSFKSVMLLLRKSLCGLKEGPGIAEMMELLGKDASLNRLKAAHKYLTRL